MLFALRWIFSRCYLPNICCVGYSLKCFTYMSSHLTTISAFHPAPPSVLTAARNFLLKHSSDYVVSLFLSLVTLKVLAPGSLSDFISHYVFPCSPSLTMLASKTPSMFLLQDVCIWYFLFQEHSFPRYLQGLLLHFIHVCTQMSPSQRILP